jgi:hydrogenase expression/formation protein HypE
MTDHKPDIDGYSCPVPIARYNQVLLAHGGGGKLTHELIEKLFVPEFHNPTLEQLHDGAMLTVGAERLAFSTDGYVVRPLFFPGGNIGELAVNGTVNDLAMCGARPLYLSVALIIEEGLSMESLYRIVHSMQRAASTAGVALVTGDTKVVDRGKGDGVFITTSGLGVIPPGVDIHPHRAHPGDVVIVSGPIAQHGIAIMSVREGLEFGTVIESDTVALSGLVDVMLAAAPHIHVLRDPTRGGVASTLNEIAAQAGVGIVINENDIPIDEQVRGACELLGFDPLYVANEGKLLAIVSREDAEPVMAAMRAHPVGSQAAMIGEVTTEHPGVVIMRSSIGSSRVVDMLSGEQLPRIC